MRTVPVHLHRHSLLRTQATACGWGDGPGRRDRARNFVLSNAAFEVTCGNCRRTHLYRDVLLATAENQPRLDL